MTCKAKWAGLALAWEPGDDGELVAMDFDRDLVAVVQPNGRWAVESPTDTLAQGKAGDVAQAQAAAELALAGEARPVAEPAPATPDFEAAPLPESVRVPVRAGHGRAADDETQARLDAAWDEAVAQAEAGDRLGAVHRLIKAGVWTIEDYKLVRRWERVRGGRLLATCSTHQARTLHVEHAGRSWSVSIPLVIWTHQRGPLPDGWQLVHLDGDRSNCHPDNLVAERLADSRWLAPAREAGQGRLFPRQPQDLERVRARQTAPTPEPRPAQEPDEVQLTLLEVEPPRCARTADAEVGTMGGVTKEDAVPDCAAPTMTTQLRALMAMHGIDAEALAGLLLLEPETLTLALDAGWVDLAAQHGESWVDALLAGDADDVAKVDALNDLDDEDGAITPALIGQALHELAMRRLTAWVADARQRVRRGETEPADAGEQALALAKAAAKLMEGAR